MNKANRIAAAIGFSLVYGLSGNTTHAETLPKAMLIQMSLSQASVLCKSEPFTQCMGFPESECMALADQSVAKCLAPLPDIIDLTSLQNSSLEECPQQVYRDAGYSEEKAQMCLETALKAFDQQQSATPAASAESETTATTETEAPANPQGQDDAGNGATQQSDSDESPAVKTETQTGSD